MNRRHVILMGACAVGAAVALAIQYVWQLTGPLPDE